MAPMVIVTIVLLVFVANLTLFDTIDPELTAVLLLAAAQESQPINEFARKSSRIMLSIGLLGDRPCREPCSNDHVYRYLAGNNEWGQETAWYHKDFENQIQRDTLSPHGWLTGTTKWVDVIHGSDKKECSIRSKCVDIARGHSN
eukprot:scaffold400_cov185-Amphora_coffeaeformis.AAC.10